MRRRGDATAPRVAGLIPVASVLDPMLAGLKLDERFAAAQATELWADVVTPETARRARAVGVRGGELLVEVHGAVWMGHLAILRQGILEELNARLPERAKLRAIRLTPMRGKEGSGFESNR
jgi:predicted nucleic acid-binding Zn ribbon protein